MLRAKHARDNHWDMLGWGIVRALFKPGCPVCRAIAEKGDHALDVLFHEHVNDIEVIVPLIEALGFCRRHWHRARHLVRRAYDSELKIVLISDHIVQSLVRRLATADQPLEELRPRRECPICVTERAADPDVGRWLRDGLALPEITQLYRGGTGLCADHLAANRSQDSTIEATLRWPLEQTLAMADQAREGSGQMRFVGQIRRLNVARSTPILPAHGSFTCPVCREANEAERAMYDALADGKSSSTPLCAEHVRRLLAQWRGVDWPADLVNVLAEPIRQSLSSGHRRSSSGGFAWPWNRSSTHAAPRSSRSDCPICQERAATIERTLVRRASVDLADLGCLAHIRALGVVRPDLTSILVERTHARLTNVSAATAALVVKDQRPLAARATDLTVLADELLALFDRSPAET